MLLQGDHASAPAQHEQFIEGLEQIIIGLAGVGRPFQGRHEPAAQIHQDLAWRHQNEGPAARAANDDELGDMHEVEGVAARQPESADDRTENN